MQSDMRAALNLILKEFTELDYVHPEDTPNIDLYVDQVTTFIESLYQKSCVAIAG